MIHEKKINQIIKLLIINLLLVVLVFGNDRSGTTVANFLETGYGSTGISMGDAYTSVTRDITSVYWNPAGLGFMEKSEFTSFYQPTWADINNSMVAFGYVMPGLGTIALSMINVSYGDEDVTTVTKPEGTGEKFNGQDIAFNLSYGRRLAQWFSFGITGKYLQSRIWHEKGSAFAMDLGVSINTQFFSPDGSKEKGMTIAGCISNYGTRMKYDGIDLKNQVDVAPGDNGNYGYVPVRYELRSWELPLIFRFGASVNPIWTSLHHLTIAADALHTNNLNEYINIGGIYELTIPNLGILSLSGGYKGLFLDDSNYGTTYGFGLKIFMMNNTALKINYSYRQFEKLPDLHGYSLGIVF
jgi:opacity protein-like surface antigen